MSDDARVRSKKILEGTERARAVCEGVWLLPAQGNALAVNTGDGIVLMDAGPGGGTTARMMEQLRGFTAEPLRAICYSHGHLGYNDGVADWQAHNAARGDPPPQLIAHANCLRRYRRYRETLGLQRTLARMQFPGLDVRFAMVDPTLTFDSHMTLAFGPRRIELLWVPSETDDAIALWLPDERLLYAGASFPGTTIPNIGTPLRTQRFTIRWAESCERMASLGATRLVQEFGPVVEGADAIHDRLTDTAKTLRWFRAEVVARMNRGMSEAEVLADMRYEGPGFDADYLRARYGAPEYITRDLYREENGWWDRNPSSLHPAPPDAVAAAVRQAIADPEHVLQHAATLAAQGQTQLALHVVDLLALGPAGDAFAMRARELKAVLCRQRAEQVRPYVSRALYESSARLLERHAMSWSEL